MMIIAKGTVFGLKIENKELKKICSSRGVAYEPFPKNEGRASDRN